MKSHRCGKVTIKQGKASRQDTWAGLHDNVPADLLSRRQQVRQSRATQPRCTDVPHWVTTSALQPHLSPRTVTVLILKCHRRQLAPNRCNLNWRRVGQGRCRATQPTVYREAGLNVYRKINATYLINFVPPAESRDKG